MFMRLAYLSLLDRKGSVLLTIIAVSVSIFVLLGIEHIRQQAKQNFGSTVSGTDLIVGARTGNLNLLLYSVFRIGNATNNIQWKTYQEIASNPKVKWSIPMSLGDSHRGYRVMGTTTDYFDHFSYGKKRKLAFAEGKMFNGLFDVVLGAEVARKLNYSIGDKLVLTHGISKVGFSQHEDNPFKVVGILKATGTPVDQTLHVSLEAIEAIHIGWQHGVKLPGDKSSSDIRLEKLRPKTITAFLLGLTSKMATFRVQREINEFPQEPLLAILPGVTLMELWNTLAFMENSMRLISLLVLIAALLGLGALLLASIRERRREITIIRTLGASPWFLFFLIELESLLITLTASAIAISALFVTLVSSAEILTTKFGVRIDLNFLYSENIFLLLLVILSGLLISLIPAISAYRKALHCDRSVI